MLLLMENIVRNLTIDNEGIQSLSRSTDIFHTLIIRPTFITLYNTIHAISNVRNVYLWKKAVRMFFF